jgi:hypothetical protein
VTVRELQKVMTEAIAGLLPEERKRTRLVAVQPAREPGAEEVAGCDRLVKSEFGPCRQADPGAVVVGQREAVSGADPDGHQSVTCLGHPTAEEPPAIVAHDRPSKLDVLEA